MERKKQSKPDNRLAAVVINGAQYAIPLHYVEGVAPLPEIIGIPACVSRVLIGLAYINGKIMAVLDCAPLFNKGTTTKASMVTIVQLDGFFYAIKVDAAPVVISSKTAKLKKDMTSTVMGTFTVQSKKGQILNIEQCIHQYAVCS